MMSKGDNLSDLGAVPVSGSAFGDSLSDLGAVHVSQPQSSSVLSNLAQAVAPINAGATQFGANILGDIGRLTGNTPFVNQMAQLSQNAPQMYGMQNPSLAQNLLMNTARYAPYLVGGEALPTTDALASPALQQQVLGGAAYGATQSQPGNVARGTLSGMTTNLAIPAIGAAIKGGIGFGLNQFGQNIVPGIAKNLGEALNTNKVMNNAQAFGTAKANADALDGITNDAWTNLKQSAKDLDANVGIQSQNPKITNNLGFDNSSYINNLTQRIGTLSDQSQAQSGFNRAYQQPIGYLQGYLNDNTGTFSDAFAHNQALNKDLQSELNPNTNSLKTNDELNQIRFAKNALQSTIQDNLNNISNTPEGAQLQSAWQNANQLTAQKNQIFNQVATPRGGVNKSTFAKIGNNYQQYGSPDSFINDYLPKGNVNGIGRYQQLGQMLGSVNPDGTITPNQEAANNVIKMNYFNKSLNSNGVDPQSFLTSFNKLTAADQQFLFNPTQLKQISAIQNIADQNKGNVVSPFWYHTVPAVLGGIIGHESGAGAFPGAALGYFGAQAGGELASRALQNKTLQNFFVNRFANPVTQSSTDSAIPQIASALGRSSITPYTVSGGQ